MFYTVFYLLGEHSLRVAHVSKILDNHTLQHCYRLIAVINGVLSVRLRPKIDSGEKTVAWSDNSFVEPRRCWEGKCQRWQTAQLNGSARSTLDDVTWPTGRSGSTGLTCFGGTQPTRCRDRPSVAQKTPRPPAGAADPRPVSAGPPALACPGPTDRRPPPASQKVNIWCDRWVSLTIGARWPDLAMTSDMTRPLTPPPARSPYDVYPDRVERRSAASRSHAARTARTRDQRRRRRV